MFDINSLIITPSLLSAIAEIDEFKGSWKALSNLVPERLSLLKKVAAIESIGSSTRIEGSQLSNQKVEELLSNLHLHSFCSCDEEKVAGYVEVMDHIFLHYSDIPFTENYIKQIHNLLLQYSLKNAGYGGEYKRFSNSVEAFDQAGKSLGIIFETTSPSETPSQMENLIKWTRQNLVDKQIHVLLVIGIFVVSFLAIHPFQDGNGRLSRILTSLLLLKHGYAYVPYSSLDSIIEANRDGYYLALRKTQMTLKSDRPDWLSWFDFFIQSLKKQKDRLLNKLNRDNLLLESLSPLALQIVRLTKENGQITFSQLVKLTQKNPNTMKVQLRSLVKKGYLILCGKGKASWYVVG